MNKTLQHIFIYPSCFTSAITHLLSLLTLALTFASLCTEPALRKATFLWLTISWMTCFRCLASTRDLAIFDDSTCALTFIGIIKCDMSDL